MPGLGVFKGEVRRAFRRQDLRTQIGRFRCSREEKLSAPCNGGIFSRRCPFGDQCASSQLSCGAAAGSGRWRPAWFSRGHTSSHSRVRRLPAVRPHRQGRHWMLQLPGNLDLARIGSGAREVLEVVAGEEFLDGDLAAEVLILGQKDPADAALAHRAVDLSSGWHETSPAGLPSCSSRCEEGGLAGEAKLHPAGLEMVDDLLDQARRLVTAASLPG